ncbi:serine protease snake-like [Pararge aegeria]|uniref:serine protease snake-like n=1 Tax=Pararge aegeria TaxID=116150 RepID=UPI0019D1BC27|nr:serine protease snake-like [Pararge aegeria]XP_039762252.1 serine protease snake-like [Pararge aegeria]
MKAVTLAATSLLLLHTFALCSKKGYICRANGIKGLCKGVRSCPSIFKQRIKPSICSFEDEVVVCCADRATRHQLRWMNLLMSSRVVKSDQCEPIPANMTVSKTGNIALDKCLEYQEKLVLPCEESSETGKMARENHCNWKPEKLIINGEKANSGEYAHMVRLGYGEDESLKWISSGWLISDRFVVTSAHCTIKAWKGPVRKIMIAIESDMSQKSSRIYNVWKSHVHPKYQSPFKLHDIALLETEKPMLLDRSAVPACLPTGGIDDHEVEIAGWGITSARSRVMSNDLQKVTLTKFTDEECRAKLKRVRLLPGGYDPSTQVCYGDRKTPKDTCSGDSGGPVVVRHPDVYCMYSVVGVISFGRKCGVANEPGVYTRVEPYVPWIVSKVWPGNHPSEL